MRLKNTDVGHKHYAGRVSPLSRKGKGETHSISDLLRLRLWCTRCGLPFGHGGAWLGKRNGYTRHNTAHSTTDALIRKFLELEEAIQSGQNMKGFAVVLSKAFDNVPEKITFAVPEKPGMDPTLFRALRGMYS